MTDNYVIFDFYAGEREVIIEQHDFYVAEAKSRILSQFSDIETEADAKAEETLQKMAPRFDPDRHDEGDFYERAHDAAISHWLALNEMRDSVGLSVAAGMFHQFDKTLRNKVADELRQWLEPKFVEKIVWSADHPQLMDLLEWQGMSLKSESFSEQVDLLRRVINVYKHGDGPAHKKLSEKHPEFYENVDMTSTFGFLPDFDQLRITPEHFERFASAIKEFWQALPSRLHKSDMREPPNWLAKKYENFRKNN